MKTFARIINGQVIELIPEFVTIEDVDVPLSDRYHADFIAQLVEYDPVNPPEAPESPVTIPRSVTMRQARLALLAAGKLQAVSQAIAALPSPQKEAAQIEWEFAATVDRDSPFLQSLAGVLALDEAALDDLFNQAAAL